MGPSLELAHQHSLALEPRRERLGRLHEPLVGAQTLTRRPSRADRQAPSQRIARSAGPLEYQTRPDMRASSHGHASDRAKPSVDELEVKRLARELALHAAHAVHRRRAHPDHY